VWVMAALVLALWVVARDYSYQASLHAVVAGAVVLGAIIERWAVRRWVGGGVAVLLAGLAVWPARLTLPPVATDEWRREIVWRSSHAGWVEAVAWLRGQAAASGEQPGERPSGRVGVLTDWDTGNRVALDTPWPAMSSRYPRDERLRPYYQDAVEALAEPLLGSARFIVAEARQLTDVFPINAHRLGYDFDADAQLAPLGGRMMPVYGQRYHATLLAQMLESAPTVLPGGGWRRAWESGQLAYVDYVMERESGAWRRRSRLVTTEGQRTRWTWEAAQGVVEEETRLSYGGRFLPALVIYARD
jgi:hypothetical protein